MSRSDVSWALPRRSSCLEAATQRNANFFFAVKLHDSQCAEGLIQSIEQAKGGRYNTQAWACQTVSPVTGKDAPLHRLH